MTAVADAVCSKLLSLDQSEDDYVSVNVQHSKTLVIPGSSPFTWSVPYIVFA